MSISEEVLLLAGFTLGHAAWKMSELPDGDLLVPFAIGELNGKRELQLFEADTNEEAIDEAIVILEEIKEKVDAWAFAREAQMNENRRRIDLLTVTFWTKGMTEEAAVVQKFQNDNAFHLVGEPLIAIAGVAQPLERAKQVLEVVIQGISQHPKAWSLWKEWTGY